MIYIVDDFLSKDILCETINDHTPYQEQVYGTQSFWNKQPSELFNQFVLNKIEQQEGNCIKNILSFFREANHKQDNQWGIHNDSIIFGEQPDRAIVLFLESNEEGLHGTAFWEHNQYGEIYQGTTNSEFDNLIKNDYNNKDAWKLKSIIGYKQNRLLSYPCNYFHSKYPNQYNNVRRVFVMFYKIL